MNYLALVLFGLPAYFVAERKGFAAGRWLFAMGIVGLIVVFCLPSARRKDSAYGIVLKRAKLANTIGGTLAIISILTSAVATLALIFLHTFK